MNKTQEAESEHDAEVATPFLRDDEPAQMPDTVPPVQVDGAQRGLQSSYKADNRGAPTSNLKPQHCSCVNNVTPSGKYRLRVPESSDSPLILLTVGDCAYSDDSIVTRLTVRHLSISREIVLDTKSQMLVPRGCLLVFSDERAMQSFSPRFSIPSPRKLRRYVSSDQGFVKRGLPKESADATYDELLVRVGINDNEWASSRCRKKRCRVYKKLASSVSTALSFYDINASVSSPDGPEFQVLCKSIRVQDVAILEAVLKSFDCVYGHNKLTISQSKKETNSSDMDGGFVSTLTYYAKAATGWSTFKSGLTFRYGGVSASHISGALTAPYGIALIDAGYPDTTIAQFGNVSTNTVDVDSYLTDVDFASSYIEHEYYGSYDVGLQRAYNVIHATAVAGVLASKEYDGGYGGMAKYPVKSLLWAISLDVLSKSTDSGPQLFNLALHEAVTKGLSKQFPVICCTSGHAGGEYGLAYWTKYKPTDENDDQGSVDYGAVSGENYSARTFAVNAWPDWYVKQYDLCVIASVGNIGENAISTLPFAPASSMNVVAVGAVDGSTGGVDSVWSGSSHGAVTFCDSNCQDSRQYFKPELSAPGVFIRTLLPGRLRKPSGPTNDLEWGYFTYSGNFNYLGENTVTVSGTSLAAPVVACGAAWLQYLHGAGNGQALRAMLYACGMGYPQGDSKRQTSVFGVFDFFSILGTSYIEKTYSGLERCASPPKKKIIGGYKDTGCTYWAAKKHTVLPVKEGYKYRLVVVWDAEPAFSFSHANGNLGIARTAYLLVRMECGNTEYWSYTWAPYRAFDFTASGEKVKLYFYEPTNYTGYLPHRLTIAARIIDKRCEDYERYWTEGGYQGISTPEWSTGL